MSTDSQKDDDPLKFIQDIEQEMTRGDLGTYLGLEEEMSVRLWARCMSAIGK